ncbi:5'/3'-nucleotidase SurE [Mycoplasmatota bacterium]|nr:5'/3'-nucleotidase SurE [Mycoplasmatota bacterium]
MNILVVNDDGYQSKGIEILANAFRKIGNVYVVGPHLGQSGASSSITVDRGLTIHEHGNQIWSVEGTPSDCVKFALYGLKLDVNLVVSGVNNGFNIGIDTIYSGTIGATMEALFHGYKAIAFSTDWNYYDVVVKEIDSVIKYVFDYDLLSNEYLLNVNFPKIGFNESKGIMITDLAIRGFDVNYSLNENKMVSSRTFKPYEYIEQTDLWAFKHGYTSITPLKLGNGDSVNVKKLNEKIKMK